MRALQLLRPAAREIDLTTLAVGGVLTLGAVHLAASSGPSLALVPLTGIAAFGALLYLFARAPHVAVAAVIPLFTILPALRLFTDPAIGALKDVVAVVAALAAAVVVVRRRMTATPTRLDPWIVGMTTLIVGLYALNLGGAVSGEGQGAGWFHGARLALEPLVLLLVGTILDEPRRTLRWASVSFIVSAALVAAYGLVQQLLGPAMLASLGYGYNTHIRWVNGELLRSFGTFDEPFAYAAFLLFGLAAVFFAMRRGALRTSVGLLVAVGLAASFVRSAAVVFVALVGLYLASRKHILTAAFMLAAAFVAGIVIVATSEATQERTVQAEPSLYLTLNGRTDAWSVVLDEPAHWPLGKGVGVVGKAAERAEENLIQSSTPVDPGKAAVDSGYFSTIADVGLVGFAVLVGLFVRLGYLGLRAGRRGLDSGWLALAFLVVLLLDAVTRDSFTGFPTAFLGFLVIGVALAAAREEERGLAAPEARRA